LNCSFEDNVVKVLNELEGAENRKARFRTVIALILNGKEYFFEGIVDGEILNKNHGTGGFGYDPIFRPLGYDKSFAEMEMNEKNEISHRARAAFKLVDFLKNQ
jgi:XTP/dITP diphosphohydrolase